MRILFVAPTYFPYVGGLEILCAQLLDELQRRGHEVAMLTAINTTDRKRGVDIVNGVPVLRVDAYHTETPRNPHEILLMRREVATFVDRFAPDVAHAHDPGLPLWLYQQAARNRRPLLMTFHVVLSVHMAGRLGSVVQQLKAADWVTGVSEDVVGDTLSFAPEVAGRISAVTNATVAPGIAVDVPEGPPELACIGRLVPQKGFDRALDALAIVVAERPDVHLSIAGTGPSKDDLVAQIAELGLEQHVSLLGVVSRGQVADLLSQSTAVVMPSRFEGLPLVALEAAWMARPVVAADAPGLRAGVEDGVTALVVDGEDTEALAQAILRLVDDRALARKLGAEARHRVEHGRTLRHVVDDYEALYERLVAAHAS